MRPVRVPAALIAEMRRHARATYPDEACGFLVALPDAADPDAPRSIVAASAAPNDFEGARRRRFVIRPEELRSAEHALEGSERVVAGFYHSHPDHPARPSEFDRDHAWPWYTYLVLSVTATDAPAIGAFELDGESGVFREVPLETGPGADARVTESVRAPGGR
ncbi:MAG: M67 family metallopeptidase [Thermoplasmata archaeon]